MIYCVIPEPLADQLFDKMADYYKDEPGVEVIVDRRKAERRDARLHRGRPARDPRPAPPPAGDVPPHQARLAALERRRPNGSSSTSTAARAATPARPGSAS